MSLAARHLAVMLLVAPLLGCATTGYDTLTNVKTTCDTPFEEGKTVQVSGEYGGDRYHSSYLRHSDCPEIVWGTDYTDAFHARFRKALELGNAMVIGPGFRVFRVEVEGRLFISHDGRPAIEFRKLGKAERVLQ